MKIGNKKTGHLKTMLRHNLNNSKECSKHPTLRKREIPVLILGIISLIIVSLYLLGYGVALSAEDNFGVPSSSLFGSSIELLELSAWAVMQLIIKVSEAIELMGGYKDLFLSAWLAFIYSLLAWLVISIFIAVNKKWRLLFQIKIFIKRFILKFISFNIYVKFYNFGVKIFYG